MDPGQIQLGVKRSSGKSLDRYPTQGFFYGGVAEEFIGWEGWHSYNYGEQLRQHLILQICGVAQSGRAQRKAEIRFKSYPVSFLQNIFYDNPSSKREIL